MTKKGSKKVFMNEREGSWANLYGDEPVMPVIAPTWTIITNSPPKKAARGRSPVKATRKFNMSRSRSRASTRSRERAEKKSPSPPKPKKEMFNVEGKYGGPYDDMRKLQANPKYVAEMEAVHGADWKKVLAKLRRAEKLATRGNGAAKGGARKGGRKGGRKTRKMHKKH